MLVDKKRSVLDKLVQQSSKLVQSISSSNQLPSLKRNAEQLFEQSQRLAKKQPIDDRSQTRAQILFAKSGFDSQKLVNRLGTIDLRATYEPLEPIHETDLESYLAHEHELLVLTAIEEAKKAVRIISRFNATCKEYVVKEWDHAKRDLMDYFDQAESVWGPDRRSRFPIQHDKMESAVAGASPATPGVVSRSTMTRRMIEYAKVIQELNERRLGNQPFGLVSSLLQVSQAFDDREMPRKNELVNTFNLMRKLVGEDNVRLDGSFARVPRREAEFHDRTDEPRTKQIILDSAKSFLEEQYWTFVQQKCASNLSSAPLGGRMSKANYCRAFVNIVVPSELKEANYFELDSNVRDAAIPAWGVLYYCMRCGDLNEAIEYAQSTPVLAYFVPYLRSYITNNRDVLGEQRTQLRTEYLKIHRQSKDYFKQIVYNLVGKCDVSRSHNEIPRWSTEDWMWLKLNMTEVERKATEKADKTVLTLSQFQGTLRQYGIDHFKNPVLYFQLLLLSLQFEHAIKFLESNPQLSVEMMHFAVALYYYGLLRLPTVPTHQLFVDDDNGQPRLNFLRLLKTYVRSFQQSDPDVALHYLCLIQDEPARNIAIKELILETEEFGVLVGQIEIDGNRKPGFLDRFLRPDKWSEIVKLAAQSCEDNGRYDDAIKLYDLAGMYDRVLLLLAKQLGRVLTTQGPERTKIVEMAQFVRVKYARAQADPSKQPHFTHHVSEENKEAFAILLSLVSFFDAYWSGNTFKAVAEIEQLSFIPADKRDVDKCAVQFKTLSESVRRNFSEILLTLMDCYARLSQQRFDESNMAQSLKTKAKALVEFASSISFRMAPEWHAKLVRMEVSIPDR